MASPGDTTDAADINDLVKYSQEAAVGKVTVTTAQALADATDVAIQWTSEVFDSHGQHDNSTNNTRVTPNVAGVYEFWATVDFSPQTTPVQSYAYFRKNGTTASGAASVVKGDATAQNTASIHTMEEFNGTTDYFEVIANQNSAGADTLNNSVQFSSFLEWKLVRAAL